MLDYTGTNFKRIQNPFWRISNCVLGNSGFRFGAVQFLFWKASNCVWKSFRLRFRRFGFCFFTIPDLGFTQDETKRTADLELENHGKLSLAPTIPANRPNGRPGDSWPEWVMAPLLGTECRAKWPPAQNTKSQKNNLDFFIPFGRSICQFWDVKFPIFAISKIGMLNMPNRG